jgi:hypothetical protein
VSGGDLKIEREDTLVEVPRGDEVLRVTRVEATTGAGKPVSWHSLRVFWKAEDGAWRPGKAGVTIRARELGAVVAALSKELGAAPSAPATKREPLPDERYAEMRAQGRIR